MPAPTVLDTLENFKEFIAEDKLTIIDFWATWCGPCIAIAPWFKEQAEKHPDIQFGKVDVDANDEASAHAEIQCMPTFKVYKNNELIKTIEGADKEAIEKIFTADIDKMKEEAAKEKAEKEALIKMEENIPMITSKEELDSFIKEAKTTCVNFYVKDYKDEVDQLHSDLCKASADEENTAFTKENTARCDLRKHGQLGNELKITALPCLKVFNNGVEVFTLEENCFGEAEKLMTLDNEAIAKKVEEAKVEKERLAQLVKQIDDKDEYMELVKGESLVVVDYYATWCGPCIRFAPTFVKIADMPEYKDIKFVKIDCDKNTEAKTHASIGCFPTFKLWRNEKELGKLEGASKDALVKLINEHK
jgi:thioredoxin 1